MQSIDPSAPFQSGEQTSLSVHLPAEYAAWIQAHADRGGTSIGQIIQHLVDAQRSRDAQRALNGDPTDAPPKVSSEESPSESPAPLESSAELNGASTKSVVENLRSATERLRDLTNREAALDDTPDDLAHRVEARISGHARAQLDRTSAPSAPSAGSHRSGKDEANDPDTQSMFDMMDEEPPSV